MRLQPAQALSIVQARQRLLKQMSAIRQARETIVMAFGLAVLQHQAVGVEIGWWGASQPEHMHSLAATVTVQEAMLDVAKPGGIICGDRP